MPRKYTPAEAVAAFWAKVDQSGGPDACWPWTATLLHNGYGQMGWNGRHERAHRIAHMIAIGPIPPGLYVLHRCDNRPCCNPNHLTVGTQRENIRDMLAKGRGNHARGERNGMHTHPERRARGARSGAHTHPECLLRGERNGSALLNCTKVIEIRAMAATGVSRSTIARHFGVSKTLINKIVHREVWRHVD